MNGGRLSPLRSPRQFENTPQGEEISKTPVNDYAVRGLERSNLTENKS